MLVNMSAMKRQLLERKLHCSIENVCVCMCVCGDSSGWLGLPRSGWMPARQCLTVVGWLVLVNVCVL